MKKQINVKRCSTAFCIALLVGCSGSEPDDTSMNRAADNSVSASQGLISQSGAPQNQVSTAKDSGSAITLKELANEANFIFKGKLVDISNGLSVEEIPYTFVTYNVDEVIAGNYEESTITLKFVGGEFPNGNRLRASNSPVVKLGEEVVLFVQQNIDTGCEFVHCERGRFLLTDGKVIAANEKAIVVDDNNGIDYISHADQQNGSHKASLNKANVSNFISHIKGLSKATLSTKTMAKSSNINESFKAYTGLTQAGEPPVAMLDSSLVEKSEAEAQGSEHDQWEVEQLKLNGGNPLLR